MKKPLKNFVNISVLFLFRSYQILLRPYFGNACKFHPSCSHYAKDAYLQLPFLKATQMTVWRVLRCHPFTEGGLDPIPVEKVVHHG